MDKIKEVPKETIDCIISSPPYWALRDYGTGKWVGGNDPKCEHQEIRRKTRDERKSNAWMEEKLTEGTFGDELKWKSRTCPTCKAEYVDQQWGMEENFQDYLKKMNSLMQELRRVLKPTGSIWINLGDTYNSSGTKMERNWDGRAKNFDNGKPMITSRDIQTKSRIGIPERFYINCIDDGWVARNHIPWIKPNAMPSSVQDRFTNKWESVFFFAKKQKYYFNLDNVREKTITELKPGKEKPQGKMNPLFDIPETEKDSNRKMLDVPGQNPHTMHVKREEGMSDYEYQQKGNHQPGGRSHFGTGSDIKNNMLKARAKKENWQYDDIGSQGQAKSLKERQAYARRVLGKDHDSCLNDPRGKNPGDVFTFEEEPDDSKWRKHFDEKGNCFGCGKHYTKHSVKNRAQGSENRDQRQKDPYVWCNPKGKNPGDVFNEEVKFQKENVYGEDKENRSRIMAYYKTEGRKQNANPNGKNPGDVQYDHSKPYAVVERYGEVIFRRLPAHDDIREYLTKARKEQDITIDYIEEHFGNQAGHHWFEKNGSYPSVSDWLKLKDLLKFDDTFDSQLLSEYAKPAEKQNDPRGKNPGDVFVINTKPFNNAHFATFNIELPLKILKCACPQQVCKKCGIPKEAVWKRSSLIDTTDKCELQIENSQYKLGKSSALRLSGGGDTFNAWKAENPDKIIGYTDCGCNAGYEPGVVLDPFFGSGTVGVAAEKLGLNWVGIEVNPEYVSDIIKKRLDKHNNERMTEYFG